MLLSKREKYIEWGDCDPAGIVFNPRFFEWFDAATAGIFTAAGIPKPKLIQDFGFVGIPLVETRAKFISPSKFGDTVMIESSITEFGRTSFNVHHRLINAGALAVEGFETRVWVGKHPDDPARIKAQPIPQAVKDLFAAL